MIDFTDQVVIVTGAGRAHLAEISATEPFTVPGSILEEVFAVCERLGLDVISP
jgi:hypothetical protein